MKDTKDLVKKVTYYEDLLGNQHSIQTGAESVNHEIHLKFREYLGTLIKTFNDGRVDILGTTKNLWDNLEFTGECIKLGYTTKLAEDVKGETNV